MKKIVTFDFDGVIHRYDSGWQGATNIPDPPVYGIKEAIDELRNTYKIVVMSTRCFSEGGIDAIKEWLKKYEIEVDDVVAIKPPSVAYIDDRAICFDGNPKNLINKIKNFKTWQGRR